VYSTQLGFVLHEIVRYCAERGETNYSNELGQQFIEQRIESTKRLGQSRLSVIKRAVQMLSDYQQFEAVMIRRRSEGQFSQAV
jgi:hypothetical protein